MPPLLLEKNTQKLFLPNFMYDIGVRHCFVLTFIVLNGILVYDIFSVSNHSKGIILLLYFGINFCFFGTWCFIYIITKKLAPNIQIEGKQIKFCHWDFFDLWNNNIFEVNEIDHFKIINKCNPYNNIAFEQLIFTVLKDNSCIQVHNTLYGTTRRQSSFVEMLENLTGKSVSVTTEIRQIGRFYM